MYTKILVPLDGSKTAEMVLPNVVRLARESKAKVVLLTVDAPGSDSRKAGPSWSNMGDALATLERPDAQMKAYMDSAAGMLAGIGFTMALFIAGLALQNDGLDTAKVGVLVGSAISAVLGVGLLIWTLPKKSE